MKLRAVILVWLFAAMVPRAFCDVPTILDQSVSQTNVLGDSAFDLYVADDTDGTYTYQWRRNNVIIAGATDSAYTVDPSSASFPGTYTCKITNPGLATPPGGAVTSAPIVLTIWYPPVITKQPTNVVAIQGANVSFTVAVSNLPPGNFTYQWQDWDLGLDLFNGDQGDGSTNGGVTTATLTIFNVQPTDIGNYAVDVNNDILNVFGSGYDTLSTNANLTVIVPPSIIDQPDSVTNAIQGQDVFFAVGVDPSTTGNGTDPVDQLYPLSYQWRRGGVNITGQTDWFFDIPNPTPGHDNGNYDVVIKNYGGSVTSSVAQLVIFAPPALVYQMINGVITTAGRFAVTTNNQIVLFANATGTTLTYQWYFGNSPIPAATNATYSFYPANTNLSGDYSVYIANDVDSLFTDNLSISIVPEINPPTVQITSPANGLRVTNLTSISIIGQANDNTQLASVLVQQNGALPNIASMTNGGNNAVNWGINATLAPGTNTFFAQSIDIYGNQSSSVPNFLNTIQVIDIVPSPFTLLVNGPGTVSSNWTGGNVLNVGLNYNLSATPSNSFKFLSWSNSVTHLTDPNPNLTFTMSSNLIITATFAETNPPSLTITSPAANSRYTNTVTVNVQGTAADNVQVAAVMWQVNGGPWSAANGTTAWTAAVGAANGTNVFRAYSVDNGSNFSPTNSLTFVYVALDKVTVKTNGQGTVNTNYAGQMLYLGQTYSITATANTNNGFVFTNWTGGSSLPLAVLTNGATLNFVMQSNLTVQANFKDIQNPTVIITNALPGGTLNNGNFIVRGTAADNDQVVMVKYQLNNGGWQNATGTTNWAAPVNLVTGTNVFQVYSVDAQGNASLLTVINSANLVVAPAVITLKLTNSLALVSFPSLVGVTYSLEYKNALTDPAWTGLPGAVHGTGGSLVLTDSISFVPAKQRLYQVQVTTNGVNVPRPVISLGLSNGQARISLPSVAGATYRLNYKNAASDPAWSVLPSSTNGTGNPILLIDSVVPSATRFYRLREVTP
jgi:hypothetical protein